MGRGEDQSCLWRGGGRQLVARSMARRQRREGWAVCMCHVCESAVSFKMCSLKIQCKWPEPTEKRNIGYPDSREVFHTPRPPPKVYPPEDYSELQLDSQVGGANSKFRPGCHKTLLRYCFGYINIANFSII